MAGLKIFNPFKKKKKRILKMSLSEVNNRVAFLPLLFIAAAAA